MNKAGVTFLLVLATVAAGAAADPQDAERFACIAGFKMADLPSFEDYAKKFGASTIRSTGDASGFDTRVCYRSVRGDAVLELFHGEVEWGFSMHYPRDRDMRCPVAEALTDEDLNIAGVFLGMSASDYKNLSGKPSNSRGGRMTHFFEYTHVLTDAELREMIDADRKNGYPSGNPEELRRWDVGITLNAIFLNGRLSSFTVERTETN